MLHIKASEETNQLLIVLDKMKKDMTNAEKLVKSNGTKSNHKEYVRLMDQMNKFIKSVETNNIIAKKENFDDEETYSINGNDITVYKISRDVNGNPRYVVHFLDLVPDEYHYTEKLFESVLKKAKKIGGKIYRNKQFGGGIVFSSYNVEEDLKQIMDS